MNATRRAGALLLLSVWLLSDAAMALINPRFTPVNLVKQSGMILVVDLKEDVSKNECLLTVREVLKKGKTDEKVIRLDLSKARDERSAQAFRTLAAAGKPALFFVGEFEGNGGGATNLGLLHLEGQWAACVLNPEGQWLYDTLEQRYQEVWNGGTDMLRRAVDYVLQDDDAFVPVTDGVQWSRPPVKIGSLDGTIRAVRPVDLAGDGTQTLFVSRDNGDRLLACDAGARTFTDVTAARGLRSSSVAYAWGDFSGQRRLDLISFDGQGMKWHAQQADGTFTAGPLDLGQAVANGCVSLAALDVGTKDRAGLLVGGTGLPALVAFDAAGQPTVTTLTAPGIDLAVLGKAGASLVADFDGDGVADVLAVREQGSILFRGRAPGQFQAGTACAVRCGDAVRGVCIGDYDGDGRLDVLVAGGITRLMWINDGTGAFTERFRAVGEMMTHDQVVRGSDCLVADVNNDGRQDILLTYANTSPVTYFGRGFLSFGHSHTLDISENNLLPGANNARDGAQSGCLADMDGDGAQDLVLALASGELWVLFRDSREASAYVVTAALPIASPHKGPVAVTGWAGKRCLGAWNVSPGTGQACFGLPEAGPVAVTWRMPDGRQETREVAIEQAGTLRVELK